MVLRISVPGKPTILIDQGPAHGARTPYIAMRRELDEAIAFAAARGHQIAKPKP